jgi:ADP-heptose:LPS heptosyltransferase
MGQIVAEAPQNVETRAPGEGSVPIPLPRFFPSCKHAGMNPPPFSRKTRTLTRTDGLAGAPLCAALTLARRAGAVFKSGRSAGAGPGKGGRILFIKLAEQGSTVLAHEALQAAVDRVGREGVYVLVFEENRFILDVLGLVPERNVLTVRTRSPWAMASSGLARLLEIRRLRIDACIDLEFFSRFSAAISYMSGARRRVGFHSWFGEGPWRGDLLTHRVPYNPHLHTGSAFASLVAALDADPARFPTFDHTPAPPRPLPRFADGPQRPKGGEEDEVKELLRGMGVPSAGRIVLLNANASDLLPLRKWEGRNYVELARRLLAEFPGLFVAFTGAPEEAAPVERLAGEVASPRCLSLAGRTTLRQLLIVYGLSEVLVTNDSGPAHFAALTDVDVVALFGPETPLLFAARGPRHHPLWAGIACSPCVSAFNNRQTACRDNVCMQRIAVDRVFDTVCRIYRQRTAGRS